MIMIDGAVANWALFLQHYRQYAWSIFTGVEFVIATSNKGNMNRKWHLSVADMVLIMKTEERRKKERNKSAVSLSLPHLIISALARCWNNQGGKKAVAYKKKKKKTQGTETKEAPKKDTSMHITTAIQTFHVSIILSHIKEIGFGKESQNSETGWISAECWQLSSGEPKTEGNWQCADWDGGMRNSRQRGQWEEQTTLGRVAMEARERREVAF